MKTVKIRIAVAVDSTGRWNAAGWSMNKEGSLPVPVNDDDAMDVAVEGLGPEGDTEAHYWVEAEVQVPEDTVVQGTATKET